jgi:hypothetical protein
MGRVLSLSCEVHKEEKRLIEVIKMKVAVITRHAITNYGSLLQAFATQKAIENLGYSCEIIDYVRDDESYRNHEKTLLARKQEWNKNPIKKMLYLALRQPESIVAGKKFEKEQKKYLNLTKRYSSQNQLIKSKPIADVYMTGSDQVWGPVEDGSYDSSYCLSFTDKYDKRIAYAASFGRMVMSPKLEEFFKNWLGRYSYITVREDSAMKLLQNIGIEANQVLDPSLLFDESFWRQYMVPIKAKQYILVYQIHNDKRVGKYAKKVAKSLGVPLIRISSSFHQIMREGRFVWCPSIGEFLSFIKNARCLITDSFHGTAFAIDFHTPFVEVLPNNNTGTRNVSILNLTGLSGRILNNDDDIALAEQPIDFVKTERLLEEKRKESIALLKRMIED